MASGYSRRENRSLVFAALLLFSLVTLAGACSKGAADLPPNYDNLLPHCQGISFAPEVSFEGYGEPPKGTAYSNVDSRAERACRGGQFRVWMSIMRFPSPDAASSWMDEHALQEDTSGFPTEVYSEEVRKSFTRPPDEIRAFTLRRYPTEEGEDPAISYTIFFRVGRYVGDFAAEDREAWIGPEGVVGDAKWSDVEELVEYVLRRWQTLPA